MVTSEKKTRTRRKPAAAVISNPESGLVKVGISLITLIGPFKGWPWDLDAAKGQLPNPKHETRGERNDRLHAEAETLDVVSYHRSGGKSNADNNGVQPFLDLIGRHVSGKEIADMITEGGYHATYVKLTDEAKPDWVQFKIELRPGPAPKGEGVLSPSQLGELTYAIREDLDVLKVAGLWVNPKRDREGKLERVYFGNLVLRAQQEETLDLIKNDEWPVCADDLGYHVEIPRADLEAIFAASSGTNN